MVGTPGEEGEGGGVPSLTQRIGHLQLKKWIQQAFSCRLCNAAEVLPRDDDFSEEAKDVVIGGADPATSYLVKNQEDITYNVFNQFRRATDYQVENEVIDLSSLVMQRKITIMMGVESYDHLKDVAQHLPFNREELAKTLQGITNMAVWGNLEQSELQTVMNM